MQRYKVTVTYKEIGEDKKPFVCKEVFIIKASSMIKANEKASKIMYKQFYDEYTIVDIQQL